MEKEFYVNENYFILAVLFSPLIVYLILKTIFFIRDLFMVEDLPIFEDEEERD